jgi:PhnB protein
MQIQPYLNFDGRCEEALDFYRKAVGAEVGMLMRFKEAPKTEGGGMCAPGSDDKIMHAAVRIGDATVFASDGYCRGAPKFEGISLSLSAKTDAEAQKLFAGLSEGGQVQVPLSKTFFASSFGMVTDRFGVPWMVVVM